MSSKRSMSMNPWRWLGLGLAGLALGASGSYLSLTPNLPDISVLRQVTYETPLQVYTRDGQLITQFGVKRTIPLRYHQIPPRMIQAVLAAEDDRFFEHEGIDYLGLARAASEIVTTGGIRSGGSTITMQVAKNYFLSSEKTFSRKFTELLLAKRIEDALSKEEILELYLNRIFLGQRAYGIGAAAEIYYGKTVGELTLPEMAMLAGLPKAPSRFNPVVNPRRAVERRNWILGRMLELGWITATEHRAAVAAPVGLNRKSDARLISADWVAEMVREQLLARFGERIYTSGYKVFTTLDSRLQTRANESVIQGLMAYDRRHGWRGVESTEQRTPLDSLVRVGGLEPARVVSVERQRLVAQLRSGEQVTLTPPDWAWARPYRSVNSIGPVPQSATELARVNDIIRLQRQGTRWQLAQIPAVQGSLVAVHPEDGAVLALVGGFDFGQSRFNRVTQGWRQAGSTIKPFIYARALERGRSFNSTVNDAPREFPNWKPQNSDGEFKGEMPLYRALALSRNLVSIGLLEEVGVDDARSYLTSFGLERQRLPRDLTLALGSADVLSLQMVTAYAAIANGGLRIQPYFVDRVEDLNGRVLFKATPRTVCRPCEAPPPPPVIEAPPAPVVADASGSVVIPVNPPVETPAPAAPVAPPAPTGPVALRIMTPEAAWFTYHMLQRAITSGTGAAARSLGRSDIGGKTGTTNEAKDAWFAGFNTSVAAVAWVGFDEPAPLGRNEYGGVAALPIWNGFMATALAGTPVRGPVLPNGLTPPLPATAPAAAPTDEAAAAPSEATTPAPAPEAASEPVVERL